MARTADAMEMWGRTTGTLEQDRFIHMNDGIRFEYRRE
jgi:hypothetical protein